jgi:hypothetical protein
VTIAPNDRPEPDCVIAIHPEGLLVALKMIPPRARNIQIVPLPLLADGGKDGGKP